MLATTTNLNRFLNKTERIIRNDYNEKGLIVCARIDNVFAINYNDIPFILSVNVAPFNVIVYSIALSSDSKNYIIKSRGTCGNQEDVINDIYVDLLHYVRDNNICLEKAETTEKEDCKTVKEKEQYFDTDDLQPNKKIIAKDEKRKLVFDINQILKDGIRNLYKCENHISFEVLERYVIRKCDELIRRNRLKAFWFSYIARQLDEVRRNTIYLYTPYITAHRNRW